MTDLTETERNLLGRYFGMGIGSDVTSHEPHETLGKNRHAWDRLINLGLVKVEPINEHGSKRLTCTDEAAGIGRDRMRENMRALLVEAILPTSPVPQS